MKRSLRISGHRDYVAVDLVNEKDEVVSTPFYYQVGRSVTIMYLDEDEGNWYKTKLSDFDFDKRKFKAKDSEMEYDIDVSELLEEKTVNFIQPQRA